MLAVPYSHDDKVAHTAKLLYYTLMQRSTRILYSSRDNTIDDIIFVLRGGDPRGSRNNGRCLVRRLQCNCSVCGQNKAIISTQYSTVHAEERDGDDRAQLY